MITHLSSSSMTTRLFLILFSALFEQRSQRITEEAGVGTPNFVYQDKENALKRKSISQYADD